MGDYKDLIIRNKNKLFKISLWFLFLIVLFSVLRFCYVNYLPDNKKSNHPTDKVNNVEPLITVDDALDAMLRGHPNAQTICFDSNDGFFVKYGKPQDDKYFNEGWYFVKHQFFVASNGKLYIQNITSNNYVLVYPDVTGLVCKEVNI